MARQSDDQQTVHMHLLPRSSLALPDLTYEPVQACRSLPGSWLSSSTRPAKRAVVRYSQTTEHSLDTLTEPDS